MGVLAKIMFLLAAILVCNVSCFSQKHVPSGYKKYKAKQDFEYLITANWENYNVKKKHYINGYPNCIFLNISNGKLFSESKNDSVEVSITVRQTKLSSDSEYYDLMNKLEKEKAYLFERRKLASGEDAVFYNYKVRFQSAYYLKLYSPKNRIATTINILAHSTKDSSFSDKTFKLLEFSNKLYSYIKVR